MNNQVKELKTNKIVFSWLLVIAMACFIFYMSAKSGDQLDNDMWIISSIKAWLTTTTQAIFGKPIDVSSIGHFGEYFAFGLTLANALRFHLRQPQSSLVAFLTASLYGVSDEIHQIFVPTRFCDPMDWLVDSIAAALAIALFALIMHLRKTRHNQESGV